LHLTVFPRDDTGTARILRQDRLGHMIRRVASGTSLYLVFTIGAARA
jgi:hypothetical protein